MKNPYLRTTKVNGRLRCLLLTLYVLKSLRRVTSASVIVLVPNTRHQNKSGKSALTTVESF